MLILALCLILLGSLVGNYLVYRWGRHFYLKLNQLRLDPLELGTYPPAGAETPPPGGPIRVVFFGDSRAWEWPAPAGLDRFEFLNRGVNSQTSAQVLARFDDHLAPLAPQVIVLQVGINDLKTIPLFPDRRAAIVAGCRDNVAQIVARGRDLGSTVILTTIFPLARVPLARRPFWSGDVARAIDEVNAYLGSLAGERVIVLDTAPILVDERGIVRDAYSRDMLHLAPAGYEALNGELARLLAAMALEEGR